jgi:hypothetical protein
MSLIITMICLIVLPFNSIALNKSNIFYKSESTRDNGPDSGSNQLDIITDGSCSTIPDYYQNDTSFGGFPDGGQMYCGPVAVSNSLMYLMGNAIFQNTFPSIQSKRDQHTLISLIASPRYIGTGKMGTSPSGICKGVDRFLLDNNFSKATLSYYGWRPVPVKYHKQSRADFITIENILGRPDAAIWLNFGWYTYQKDRNQFIRTGGHWVTLINFLHRDTLSIIVHDPATRQTGNDTLHLRRLSDGFLVTKITILPVCASGYYVFTNKSGQFGIIDGFITLVIPEEINTKSYGVTTGAKKINSTMK